MASCGRLVQPQRLAKFESLAKGLYRHLSLALDYTDPNQVAPQIARVALLQGDFDQDGVDGDDLVLWQKGYSIINASHMDGDADGDLSVGGGDFLIWRRQAGINSALPTNFAVPEPSAGLLALCALLSGGYAAFVKMPTPNHWTRRLLRR